MKPIWHIAGNPNRDCKWVAIATAVAAPLLALLWSSAASAQASDTREYPTKPIRMIVPFPAGGPTDIVGRIMAQKLSEALGQQVVVDNRGGASGIIGTDMAAKSPPDGYTLLMAPSALAIVVSLYKSVPYDPLKDLAPVIRVASTAFVLVVHPSVPATNVKQLIALLKTRPKEFSYASAGNGTPQHLTTELFKTEAHVRMTHVPYKGSAPAINDVIAGQVPVAFDAFLVALAQIKAGRLRALAQTGRTRSIHLPHVPTKAETVLPGFEAIGWFGLFAPAGTPQAIIARLHEDAAKAFNTPEVKQRLIDLGSDLVIEGPEQFRAFIAAEIVKWVKVIEASGAKVD